MCRGLDVCVHVDMCWCTCVILGRVCMWVYVGAHVSCLHVCTSGCVLATCHDLDVDACECVLAHMCHGLDMELRGHSQKPVLSFFYVTSRD